MMGTTSKESRAGHTPDGSESDTPSGLHRDPDRLTGRRRWRQRIVNTLAVLTCVGMLISAVAVWSHRTLLDTDAWMDVVGPLASDPEVTDAIAVALTDQVYQLVQPEEKLREALPPKAAFLAAPLSTAVRGYVQDGVETVLASDQFQQFWNNANRQVHESAVKILRGQPVLGFQATDGVVTFNLFPLITRVLTFIDSKAHGLFGDRTIPVITQDTPPDQARQQLADGLDVTIPGTFGVVTLFRSDDLLQAQQLVQLFDTLVIVIVALTALMFVASIALSLHRRRTLILLGAGTALAMALARAGTNALQRQVVGRITGTTQQLAVNVTISNLVDALRTLTDVLMWGAVILVIVSVATGDGRPARSLRHAAATGLSRLTGHAGDPTETSASRPTSNDPAILPLLHDHLTAFQVAGIVVAMVWLLLGNLTWASLGMSVAVLALYEVAIAVLGRGSTSATRAADTDARS